MNTHSSGEIFKELDTLSIKMVVIQQLEEVYKYFLLSGLFHTCLLSTQL